MSVQFREIRGTLADSMATVIKIENRADLIRYMQKILPFEIEIEPEQISVSHYGYDHRNGWENFLVKVEGLGPVGFTDRML